MTGMACIGPQANEISHIDIDVHECSSLESDTGTHLATTAPENHDRSHMFAQHGNDRSIDQHRRTTHVECRHDRSKRNPRTDSDVDRSCYQQLDFDCYL